MARTGFFHHIGTFLLLAATVLLIITCISAPVVNDIAIMKVHFRNNGLQTTNDETVSFGTFGYCLIRQNADDVCTDSRLGYSPYAALAQATGNTQNISVNDDDDDDDDNDDDRGINFDINDNDNDDDFDLGDISFSIDEGHESAVAVRKLTKAMILHPIACGLNFIAFMLALGAGMVGSLLASLVALLAFLTTCVIMIIDFVLFSIVRTHVDDWTGRNDNTYRAHYGAAAWTILASAICSLLGTIIVFFTCCSGRLHKRRHATAGPKTDYGEPVGQRRRRRFGLF